MKEIRCDRCKTLVAKIENGSKIKRGTTMLCADCSKIRHGAEIKLNIDKNNNSYDGGLFNDIFRKGL